MDPYLFFFKLTMDMIGRFPSLMTLSRGRPGAMKRPIQIIPWLLTAMQLSATYCLPALLSPVWRMFSATSNSG